MDVRERITALAELMQEFRLAEARLQDEGVTVAFRRRSARPVVSGTSTELSEAELESVGYTPESEPVAEAPSGTPIVSPMNGIFYRSPSPSAPAFVKEGDEVSEGQVIGLIEAMKVFNEIPSPVTGIVVKIVAEAGQLVQPGDTLILVG